MGNFYSNIEWLSKLNWADCLKAQTFAASTEIDRSESTWELNWMSKCLGFVLRSIKRSSKHFECIKSGLDSRYAWGKRSFHRLAKVSLQQCISWGWPAVVVTNCLQTAIDQQGAPCTAPRSLHGSICELIYRVLWALPWNSGKFFRHPKWTPLGIWKLKTQR